MNSGRKVDDPRLLLAFLSRYMVLLNFSELTCGRIRWSSIFYQNSAHIVSRIYAAANFSNKLNSELFLEFWTKIGNFFRTLFAPGLYRLPSFIYKWSIGHILEHEFFFLGHLGSQGSKKKKWI